MNSGRTIENISIVKLTGSSVDYRAGTRMGSVPYTDVAGIKYGPISPSTQERRIREKLKSVRSKPPSASGSFARMGEEWDDLERENLAGSQQLSALSTRIARLMESMKTDGNPQARKDLNALLEQRTKLEIRVRKIRRRQRDLAERFLQLADAMKARFPGIGKKEQPPEGSRPEGGSYAGLWRSALIPGWGQLYHNRHGAGLLWLSASVAFVGYLFDKRGDWTTARSERDRMLQAAFLGQASGSPFVTLGASYAGKSAQDKMDATRLRYNAGLGLLAVLYACNLWDASSSDGLFTFAGEASNPFALGFRVRF